MGNEIERKYLIHGLPFQLSDYPCHEIEQAYLCLLYTSDAADE